MSTEVINRSWRRALLLASALLILAILAGCGTTAPDTAPAPYRPVSEYHTLYVPDDLEIVWVDYELEFATRATAERRWPKAPGASISPEAWAFVKVYAMDELSGDEYLLIYSALEEGSEPEQVIRVVRRQPLEAIPVHLGSP